MNAKYISRKTFKYGGAVIYPGQEWRPTGGKFDQKIIRCNFVRQVIEEDEAEIMVTAQAPESEATDEIEEGELDVNGANHRGGGKRGNRTGRARVHPAKDPRRRGLDGGKPGL